jgi:hypothetical protein
MKFLDSEEQFVTLVNSSEALTEGGIAMHIVHDPSVLGTKELKPWQWRVDPEKLVKKLGDKGIGTQILKFKSESNVDWLQNTIAIVLTK